MFIVGIRDSAVVATVIFTIHALILVLLVIASLVKVISTKGQIFADNFHYWDLSNPIRDIYFGFSVALLGITGFETASNCIIIIIGGEAKHLCIVLDDNEILRT